MYVTNFVGTVQLHSTVLYMRLGESRWGGGGGDGILYGFVNVPRFRYSIYKLQCTHQYNSLFRGENTSTLCEEL
jgi:hypothetical protein